MSSSRSRYRSRYRTSQSEEGSRSDIEPSSDWEVQYSEGEGSLIPNFFKFFGKVAGAEKRARSLSRRDRDPRWRPRSGAARPRSNSVNFGIALRSKARAKGDRSPSRVSDSSSWSSAESSSLDEDVSGHESPDLRKSRDRRSSRSGKEAEKLPKERKTSKNDAALPTTQLPDNPLALPNYPPRYSFVDSALLDDLQCGICLSVASEPVMRGNHSASSSQKSNTGQ